MMMPEGRQGPAVEDAYRIISTHARGDACSQCRPGWCPTQEWALWMVVTDSDHRPPDDVRSAVTTIARRVMTAHWPRGDVCRPCGQLDCDRIRTAGAWLEVHDPQWIPPHLRALLPTEVPTDDELRSITGMNPTPDPRRGDGG